MDPSRNIPSRDVLAKCRSRSGGARWAVVAPGTAGHTHAGPTHARAAGPARPTLGSGARRCALVLTAESARLADGAVRLASAPDRRCRFAIAGSPKLAPPGSGSSTSRGYVRRLPLEPASGPPRGAEPGTATTARTATGRAHAARRAVHVGTPPSDLVHSTVRRNCQTRVTRTAILYTGARRRDNRVHANFRRPYPPQFAIAV